MRPEPFKKWTRPLRLKRWLAKFAQRGGDALKIDLNPGMQPWHVVEFVRDRQSLVLRLADREQIENDTIYFYYRNYLPVMVCLLSRTRPSVSRAVAELGDGSTVPSDNLLFSANFSDAVLVPDPDFFNTQSYAKQRHRLSGQRPWPERGDPIVWRGSTTGSGQQIDERLDWEATGVKQRIRMCGMLKSLPNVDAKISRVVDAPNPGDAERRLRTAALFGDSVDESTWVDRKFALDVDGNTNAWSNLFTRLLYGCCVIKVASPHGFKQWYYDRLVPWKHFVPVRADLADLAERIEWCRSHPAESCAIAATGQQLALSMNLSHEIDDTVGRINRRLG